MVVRNSAVTPKPIMSRTDRYQCLEDEPCARLPVCFLVDQSYSMRVVNGGTPTGKTINRDGRTFNLVTGGEPPRIDQLLVAMRNFVKEIADEPRAKAAVDLAVASFGDSVTVVRDFAPVDSTTSNMSIVANDNATRLGMGVKVALQLLDRRKKEYKAQNVGYYQPQLVILTDGVASDPAVCAEVADSVRTRMARKNLICLPFLIGDETDVGPLQLFGSAGEFFRIAGSKLVPLFHYLSRSAIQVSSSTEGGDEEVPVEQILAGIRKLTVSVSQL